MKTELLKRSEIIEILESYSKFLEKGGYIDSDYKTEPPFVIDEFLKTLSTKGDEVDVTATLDNRKEIFDELNRLESEYRNEMGAIRDIGGIVPMFEKGKYRALDNVVSHIQFMKGKFFIDFYGAKVSVPNKEVAESGEMQLSKDFLKKAFLAGREFQHSEDQWVLKNIPTTKPNFEEWYKSNVSSETKKEEEAVKDLDKFLEWAHRKDWRFNTWNDQKWHNRANSHFDTKPTEELYQIFKTETKGG